MSLSRFRPRPAVAALTVVGLSFGLSACGSTDGDGTSPGDDAATDAPLDASTDHAEDPASTAEPETPDTDAPDDETPDAPPALDHPAALAAGFDGTAAVRCTYTYDDGELRQLQMLSPAADVPPEATVYLDRGVVYWDVPQPDGRVSHVLGRDGSVYTW